MFDPLALRRALAEHLSLPLTPEAAAAIFQAALRTEDRTRSGFEPERFGEHEFAVERFAGMLDELHLLHEAHWMETERHRHGLQLDPDYTTLVARERAGNLMQFTVRRDATLVGHCRMYIGKSLHTQTMFAEEDTLYVVPQARGGFMVMALLRYVERTLRAVGVREIRTNSKLVNRADVLMKRMGYTPVALQFVKIFKEDGDVL